MIRKAIIIFCSFTIACNAPPATDDEFIVPVARMLVADEMNLEEMQMVSGMVFEVENFNTWMENYGKVAKGLIIAFRNVDAPNVTLVFEGSKTLELAEERVALLSSDRFLENSSAFGDPIASFYQVKYVDTVANPPAHFFALSYPSDGNPEENWFDFVERHEQIFAEMNIQPSGIGTDPRQPDRGYLLFRQYDFVASRKLLNSPRKINRFLESLDLPENTLISYWIRISQ